MTFWSPLQSIIIFICFSFVPTPLTMLLRRIFEIVLVYTYMSINYDSMIICIVPLLPSLNFFLISELLPFLTKYLNFQFIMLIIRNEISLNVKYLVKYVILPTLIEKKVDLSLSNDSQKMVIQFCCSSIGKIHVFTPCL